MSPVQGESPLVQVKEPSGNFDMVTCRLSSCNPECTKYTRKRVWQYIEKERINMIKMNIKTKLTRMSEGA